MTRAARSFDPAGASRIDELSLQGIAQVGVKAVVSVEARHWFDLGRRALTLGWTWRPGMWALDERTTDLHGAYEVVLADGVVAARRIRDGHVVALESVVPYLNDGTTEEALLDRVRLLRNDVSFDLRRGSVGRTGTAAGWIWSGAVRGFCTRAEALVEAGEAARVRLGLVQRLARAGLHAGQVRRAGDLPLDWLEDLVDAIEPVN